MKRKVREEEASAVEERWLLTYSDMITLLLALFILLYSISTVDMEKYKAIADSMGSAFNNPAGGSGGGAGSEGGASEGGDIGGDGGSEDGTGEGAMTQLYDHLNNFIKEAGLEDQVEITGTSDYVEINLKDGVLFVPNSPQMLPGGSDILIGLEGLIIAAYNQIGRITISGHTAYVQGLDSPQNEEFGWTLSSDRALNVLNVFIQNGLPPNKFSIEGCSYFQPVADNATAEGRSKNRRVSIVITK